MDATHLCQQRAGGAHNWEAYIKDNRDAKIYKVIVMPNNEWWFADYLDYEQPDIKTIVVNGLRFYTAWPDCPAAWTTWDVTKAKSLITNYGGTNLSRVKAADTWASTYAGDDYYGLHIMPTCLLHQDYSQYDCRSNSLSQVSTVTLSSIPNRQSGINGNAWSDAWEGYLNWNKCADRPCSPVRCYRQ
jgi:uncharacterized protein (TIGR02145 family)